MIPDDCRHRVARDVLSRQLGGETVLLDLASGTYFGLNDVAASIWGPLSGGATVAELQRRVVETFEVTPERARTDLEGLLEDLERRGLIERLRDSA